MYTTTCTRETIMQCRQAWPALIMTPTIIHGICLRIQTQLAGLSARYCRVPHFPRHLASLNTSDRPTPLTSFTAVSFLIDLSAVITRIEYDNGKIAASHWLLHFRREFRTSSDEQDDRSCWKHRIWNDWNSFIRTPVIKPKFYNLLISYGAGSIIR